MAFLAYHMSNNPRSGTVFALMENGQIVGQPKRDFPSQGEEFSSVGPDDVRRAGEVIDASSQSMTVKLHDGTTLTLRPWASGDMDPNFHSPMHFAYWTAR